MNGFRHLKKYLNQNEQQDLLIDILAVIEKAPLYTPTMPKTGRPFSVRETNCGPLGWVSDKSGYRYQPTHPLTKEPWPAMPKKLKQIWQDLSNVSYEPEAALINHYLNTAKMGLHQDKDEQDFKAPVISISLGNSAKFRLGGTTRKEKTRAIDLHSGDIVILGHESRLAYHGIDRIFPETSDLLSAHGMEEGRLNITLRRVTKSTPKNE